MTPGTHKSDRDVALEALERLGQLTAVAHLNVERPGDRAAVSTAVEIIRDALLRAINAASAR